jgi:hypothetical protein
MMIKQVYRSGQKMGQIPSNARELRRLLPQRLRGPVVIAIDQDGMLGPGED